MRRMRGLVGIGSVLVVGTVGLGSVGLGSVGLGSAGAQVVPTLEVSPLRVDPQEVVTFTVRDCSVAPELQVGESDFVRLVEPTATGVPGEWSAQLEAGLTDWTVTGTCGDVDLGEVVVDVDNPLMAFLPIGAFAPEPDPPSEVFGSDCPDGTEATVTFEDEVNGFRDVQTAAIEGRELVVESFAANETDKLIEKLGDVLQPGDLMLVKGSRGLEMENIVAALRMPPVEEEDAP